MLSMTLLWHMVRLLLLGSSLMEREEEEIRLVVDYFFFVNFEIYFEILFQWLSPEGCCMFSLQIHVPLDSPLGSRIPLVQHLLAIAVVKAIKGVDGLQVSFEFYNKIFKGV